MNIQHIISEKRLWLGGFACRRGALSFQKFEATAGLAAIASILA